jgi:hypothetical protein
MSKNDPEPFAALFERARRDAFTPAELDELWQGVTAAGPPSALRAELATGRTSASWSASTGTVKLVALLVVAGGLGVAGFAATRTRAPVVNDAPFVSSPSTRVAPRAQVTASEAAGPPTISFEELPRAPGAPPITPHAPHARSAAGPSPAAEVETPAPAPDVPAAAAQEAPVEPAESTPSEGALLLRARQSLAADPTATLALTDEASRRFPAGPLAPEREVLAIEALAQLHRAPEARTRLVAFRARYPKSPHLARLGALLGSD